MLSNNKEWQNMLSSFLWGTAGAFAFIGVLVMFLWILSGV